MLVRLFACTACWFIFAVLELGFDACEFLGFDLMDLMLGVG